MPASPSATPSGGDPGPLADPFRLATLRRTGLLHGTRSPVLDQIARFATTFLEVPVALVSLVDERGQHFPGMAGLAGWAAEARGTPLSHSFCQHVVHRAAPLVIDDAGAHRLVRDNAARSAFGVVAYVGLPLTTEEGDTLGAICAIDGVPRQWTAAELEALGELGALALVEIERRVTAHALAESQAALARAEERLARALAAARMGTWEWDVCTDRVEVDGAWGARFGLEAGAAAPTMRAFLALVHPDDRLGVRAALDDARAGRDAHHVGFRISRPGGSAPLRLDVDTIARDAEGRVERLAGMVRDLTPPDASTG